MVVMCRLLAWATDIEAQLESQRQELRRSRVELAAAQEVCPKLYCQFEITTVVITSSSPSGDGLIWP